MRTTTRSALAAAFATLAMTSAVSLASPATATAHAPGCSQAWGSTAKSSLAGSSAVLTGVRAGRHACFDRLVLDTRGSVRTYWVRYVPQVRASGSGDVVPTRGGARLEVTAGAPSHDQQYRAVYQPPDGQQLADVRGFRTFRQVTWAGSFEGSSTLGLGVRARLPFRVLTLPGPGNGSRLVVDVAHRW